MQLEDMKEFAETTGKNFIQKPKMFFLICAGIVIFVSIIAVTVFFLSVRGADETMVPDVREKQLVSALMELQQKELYPRIQLRYSKSAEEKNTILEQDPRPGTIVKAGRRIRLVVSQGVMVSAVDKYIGRNIDEVRLDLQTLNANNPQPVITFKEPFLYQYSSKPMGTILEQNPAPGVGIASTVALEFVISKGARKEYSVMPGLIGLKLKDALPLIEESGIRWTFDALYDASENAGDLIIAQDPETGSALPADRVARITVAEPTALSESEVFAVFKYDLPENPYPLLTKLEIISPEGQRRTVTEIHHAGGEFTYPYRAEAGSTLVLSLIDRELYREEIPIAE